MQDSNTMASCTDRKHAKLSHTNCGKVSFLFRATAVLGALASLVLSLVVTMDGKMGEDKAQGYFS
jgi:hypothetical protein